MFSKKKIGSSVAIVVVCLIGDKNSVPLKEADLAAAVCDNITHALVGAFTWLSIWAAQPTIQQRFYLEALFCAFISSVIDIDHFIAVKSLDLKKATKLTRRPILHCTSGALIVSVILLALSILFHIKWLYRFAWILIAAFLSHHIRDSTRRGFWLCPFGSTKPTPYILYVILEASLPHAISVCMNFMSSYLTTQLYENDDSFIV